MMQRYGDSGLIPRNKPGSCCSCCDSLIDLRQSRGKRLDRVVKSIDISPCASLSRDDNGMECRDNKALFGKMRL